MSELTLQMMRLGLLVLLWVFVMSVLGVARSDMFGAAPARRRRPSVPGRGAGDLLGAPAPMPGQPTTRAQLRSLVVTEGALRGMTLALGQSTILMGRAPENTIVVEDDYASGHHARVYQDHGSWFVEDLGSTNGTYVGRMRIDTPTRLDAGTPVRVGRTVFELRR